MDLTVDWYLEDDGSSCVAVCHLCRWRETHTERAFADKALSYHLSTVEHLKRVRT